MPDVPAERVRVLHVSYDGLLQPRGRSQVVSYLLGSAGAEVEVGVLSFERPEDLRDRERRVTGESELAGRGITWKALSRGRAPLVWNLLRGALSSLAFSHRHHPDVVHARGYAAALMAFPTKAFSGARLVFDMRGFWPEEQVELGVLRTRGLLFRVAKLAERALLSAADHVIVVTEAAKAILRDREAETRLSAPASRELPITVVPCCVDLDRFRPLPRDDDLAREHELSSALVVGNLGAFNGRYLAPEIFRFAFHLKTHRPELRFVYLTPHEPAEVRATAREAGLREEDVLVLAAASADVPRWLSLFRLGIFFLRPSYAAKGSGYTKLAELLACGVPVVTNTGVGDVDRILAGRRCGLVLPGVTDRDLAAFARQALPYLEGERTSDETRRHCREAAEAHFALDEGVRRHRAIYESLGKVPAASAALAAEEIG